MGRFIAYAAHRGIHFCDCGYANKFLPSNQNLQFHHPAGIGKNQQRILFRKVLKKGHLGNHGQLAKILYPDLVKWHFIQLFTKVPQDEFARPSCPSNRFLSLNLALATPIHLFTLVNIYTQFNIFKQVKKKWCDRHHFFIRINPVILPKVAETSFLGLW